MTQHEQYAEKAGQLVLSAEDVLRAGLFTSCREEVCLDRCNAPAEFVLWGRLFKPEALGPRCYDHAVQHTDWHMPTRSDQYAVIDLRPIRRALSLPPVKEATPHVLYRDHAERLRSLVRKMQGGE